MNEMSINQILKANFEKNYKGNGLTLPRYFALIKRKIAEGQKLFRYKNILILYTPINEETLEYHPINGGMSWDELDKSVLAFALTMRDRGIKYIVTFFNDEKLKKGFKKQNTFPVQIDEVDDPRGKFIAIGRLS